jgi:hypothetical protein
MASSWNFSYDQSPSMGLKSYLYHSGPVLEMEVDLVHSLLTNRGMHSKHFIDRKNGTQQEWWKQARPYNKRKYNKQLRKDGKEYARKEGREEY